MASLSELRAIHAERIDDERRAFEHQRQAEAGARHAAEQAARVAAETRVREQRDAELRLQEARVTAEREARLSVEKHEAAERARHDGELAAQRQHQELELRRAAVAKQRPRWMIVVTGLAVCAGFGLAYVAVRAAHEADAASEQRRLAETEKQRAHEQAAEAQAQLASMIADLDTANDRLSALQRAVIDAQDDADRRKVMLEIAQARREASDKKARLDKWKRDRDAIERGKGLHQDPHCLDTALGCLK